MKKLIIMLAALARVAGFTASAMADVSLYGSARFHTERGDTDKEFTGTLSDFTATSLTGEKDFDTRHTQWRMGNLSRFGAIFKGDTVGGRFEMDARTNQADTDTDGASGLGAMRLRLLYGTWNFGSGELLIGQNYPLYNFAISSIAFTTGGLQLYGGVAYANPRVSQIRFTFGDFKLAFLTPVTNKDGGGTYSYTTEPKFPKIEVEYDLKLDPVALQLVGGWQSYDALSSTDDSKSVTSWVIAGAGKVHFGPAYINLALSYRVNGGNYGVWTTVNENAQFVNGDFQDATTFGAVGALGFKVNDMITLEASAGYLSADYDNLGSAEDTSRAYGLLAQIHLAPGVMIQPEFVVLDKDKVKNNVGTEFDQGKETAVGIWWKIDFK
jgi:hypothetical protein